MDYIARFKQFFALSGKAPDSALGLCQETKDHFIAISRNKYGLVKLSFWERYDDYTIELAWFGEQLVLAEGNPDELAVLVWIADQIGLPDHPDFAEIRKSPRYADIAAKGITLE